MRGVVIIWGALVLPVKICYRSMCNHPFLAALASFLGILYRSFPLLFSLLVSASPVLVCTAVLLGTLLSYGELNIPKVETEREVRELVEEEEEEEEEISHVVSSLRAPQAVDGVVMTKREGNFGLEKLVEKIKDVSVEDDNLTEDDYSKIGQDDNVPDYMPLINENSLEELHEEMLIEESELSTDSYILKKIKEVVEAKVGNKEDFVHFQVSVNDGASSAEPDDPRKNGEMDFPVDWKQLKVDNHEEEEEEDEEEKDEDDEAFDSESDRAESSSPDASMADIIPMLDELHPLLDEEAPQLAERSIESSEAGSDISGTSNGSSIESDDDTEDQDEEEEDGVNDIPSGEVEEVHEGKDEESKSAIKWTEDDQKNLLDLGSLELERNQRLESLIARRRARRNMRLMAEKNLIDLDGADLPVNVPPILATRQNPFDLPYDPFDDVPGSAPSILLPRKNPFDLPYEPNEEKPDLKGDSFQQEFSAPSQREPVFRRHESFSVGPSVLGIPRHERQDLRWKPYFVPERFAGEGHGVLTFQRQLSEASESKLSSARDTESASSVVDEEEIEEETKNVIEEDFSHERETIHVEDRVSLLVERGSFSTEDVDAMDVEETVRNVQRNDDDEVNTSSGDVEHQQETDSNLSASGEVDHVEHNAREILLQMGLDEEEYSSESVISSMSDSDENISGVNQGSETLKESADQSSLESQLHNLSGVKEDNHQQREPVMETMPNHSRESYEHEPSATKLEGDHVSSSGSPKQRSLETEPQQLSKAESDTHHDENVGDCGIYHIDESGTSGQTSTESDWHISGAVMDDSHHRDPVYDLSPASSAKFLSLHSVSSDSLREILELSSSSALAELPGTKSELQPDIVEKDSSHYKEIGEAYSLNEMEVRLPEDAKTNENYGLMNDEKGVDLYHDSQNGSPNADPEIQHDSVMHSLANDQESLKEGGVYKEESSFPVGNQNQSSSQTLVEEFDSSSSNHLLPKVTVLPTVEEHPMQETTQSSDLDPSMHDAFKTEESISSDSISAHMHPKGTITSRHEEGRPVGFAEITNQDATPSVIMYLRENSARKEEALEFENSHARFPASDARTDILDLDVYEEIVYAKEESSHRLEKWDSWSDKSMVESSSEIHDISLEPSFNPSAKIDEMSINEKTSTPDADDHEETTSVALVTSDLSCQSPDGIECSSSPLQEDMMENTLDKIVYETTINGSEHSNQSSESYECFSAEEDEIKEIDEKLLSELDSVGGYHVKEVVGESTLDEKIVEGSVTGQSEVMPVGDVEFTLEQLHERENVEEVILPNMSENELVSDDSRDLREHISDQPSIEASFLEDVSIAMKQVSDGDTKEQPDALYSKERVVTVNEDNLVEQHQIHKNSAFTDANETPGQTSEAVDVQEAVPSIIGNQMVVGTSQHTVRTSSDIPVVDSNAESASEQLSGVNIAEQSKSSETMNQPLLEVRESTSPQGIEPSAI